MSVQLWRCIGCLIIAAIMKGWAPLATKLTVLDFSSMEFWYTIEIGSSTGNKRINIDMKYLWAKCLMNWKSAIKMVLFLVTLKLNLNTLQTYIRLYFIFNLGYVLPEIFLEVLLSTVVHQIIHGEQEQGEKR